MNIMNRNTIISLAMLYALWQSKRQDLLDLIRPFVLYAVGTTTATGNKIDVEAVCACMESEFGYKSVQTAVVNRILVRETSFSIPKENRKIEKRVGQYYLVA